MVDCSTEDLLEPVRKMRNENLDLAQSSGSESSPSWAAATTPKASTFNFEFGHQSHNQNQQQQNAATSGGVEDLTKQFKVSDVIMKKKFWSKKINWRK